MTEKPKFQVIVIGGGLAGLSAANHLVQHGVKDILVLEAKDRLGGRIFTLQHNGSPLDLGAQWIHGGCPANSLYNFGNRHKLFGRDVRRLHEEADEDNLLTHWPTTIGYIYRPDGQPISEEATRKAYEIFNSIIEEAQQYKDRHYGIGRHTRSGATRLSTFYNGRKHKATEALRKSSELGAYSPSFLSDVDMALAGLGRVLAIETGDDISKVRLEMFGSRVTLPGGHVPLPHGANSVIDRLKKPLPEGCIRLQHEVTHVDWSLLSRDPRLPDKVAVECVIASTRSRRDFRTFYADYVICTLPLGVLKRCHTQLFHPHIDDQKVEAIENLGFGQLAKIFLHWKDPWWAPGEGGIQLAWPTDVNGFGSLNRGTNGGSATEQRRKWYKGICNFSEVDHQPNLLVCWLAGDTAAIADELDDEEVMLTVMDVLRQFTGDPGLPSPVKVIRQRWTTDPYILGSGVYPSITSSDEDFENLFRPLPSPADPRLLFAGEATHPQYWGQMLGARLSGLREAERILGRIESVNRMAQEMQKIASSALACNTTTTPLVVINPPSTPVSSSPHESGLPPLPPTIRVQKPILVKAKFTTS